MESPLDNRRRLSPRPDALREQWMDLSGAWEFEFDPANLVDGDDRHFGRNLSGKIQVPFVHQSRASGVGDTGFYPCLWYRTTFKLDRPWEGGRTLLNFGAVDGDCMVWVNGALVGTHTGGYDPFRFDLSTVSRPGDNELVVKVVDDLDPGRPRGKQAWGAPAAVWYTPMSGIWQPVWLESTGQLFIEDARIEVGDPDTGLLMMSVRPNMPCAGALLSATLSRGGREEVRLSAALRFPATRLAFRVPNVQPWSAENPNLYDLSITLEVGGEQTDRIDSYAGFRAVDVDEHSICVNGKNRFLRLVLDQGYWPETLYTPPSSDALRADIASAKTLGFEGCRKHLKAEDPRFLYWADKLGYLVWTELPAVYRDGPGARLSLLSQLAGGLARDRNHPSVIAHVLYNESWGIQEVTRDASVRDWVRALARLARNLDPDRLVIDNDGWEQVDSDLTTYHSYAVDGPSLVGAHKDLLAGNAHAGRRLRADGGPRSRTPVIASEFGGIAYRSPGNPDGGWGYAGIPVSEEEFFRRFESLFRALYEQDDVAGFCYTQLTDVEREINGLLAADRTPKFSPERIFSIVRGSRR